MCVHLCLFGSMSGLRDVVARARVHSEAVGFLKTIETTSTSIATPSMTVRVCVMPKYAVFAS